MPSPESVDAAVQRINQQNDACTARLAALLGRQTTIDAALSGIGRSLAGLRLVQSDAARLTATIDATAALAHSVSAKVRRLDEARTRVSDCQQRVHDLIDLQLCAAGVSQAIGAEDYEAAAAHIDRFLGMDQALLRRTGKATAETDSDDTADESASAAATATAAADSTDPDAIVTAVAKLEAAAAQLRHLITLRFDEAAAADDLAGVERFFKLFPLVRQHSEGMARFADYICTKLQAKAAKELRAALDVAQANRRGAVAYADTLTQMLENLARVVEVNEPIVVACYGRGHLMRMVVRLQRECDEQFRRLLHEFNNGRHVPHRMSQIDEQLAAKTLSTSAQSASAAGDSSSGTGGTGGGPSTANKTHRRHKSGSSLDKLNPKDIDGLLGEISVMLSRIDLYERFMRRKVLADLGEADADGAKRREFEAALRRSDLPRQTQELLNVYLLFERYFIEESCLKAIALDVAEPGQPCSSMVDDVYFIARKSIRRAAATQSLSGCSAVINMAAAVLETDVVQAVHAALRVGYPPAGGYIDLAASAYQALHSTMQRLPATASSLTAAAAAASAAATSSDTSGDRVRQHFVVQLNNADQAAEHAETLWQQMGDELRASAAWRRDDDGRERDILDSCLGSLRAVRDRWRAEVAFGIQQLRSSVLRPRLHQWIVDQFVARRHEIGGGAGGPDADGASDAFSADAAGDHGGDGGHSTGDSDTSFVQALIIQLDAILAPFRPPAMVERNFDALVAQLAADVTERWEVAIRRCRFDRMGGLRLDQEVRQLGMWLSAATAWSVRDKMVRLTQMATLLNLEQVSELTDYWQPAEQQPSAAGPTWQFSNAEVKTILSLRSDFRTADIKRLKF